MSVRYVYDIYNTTVANRQLVDGITLTVSQDYNWATAKVCNSYEASVAYDRDGQPVTLYTTEDEPNVVWMGMSYSNGGNSQDYITDTAEYKYIILKKFVQGNHSIVGECYLLESIKGISGAFWHGTSPTHTMSIWNNNSSTVNNKQDLKNFYKSGGTIAKGSTLVSTQSATSKSLTEGAFESGSTWRWRTYRGSDTIDPTAVTYSKSDLYPGDSVEISVAPRTPTYGGTISYQYQYSLDGGSTWANIGSKTTETTASVTIPEGAKQFQARVTASDGWGFTSTTPVAGPSLGVSQLKAYASVDGKAKAGTKLFVTVDGKVREVTRGYATVGGIIRKIF